MHRLLDVLEFVVTTWLRSRRLIIASVSLVVLTFVLAYAIVHGGAAWTSVAKESCPAVGAIRQATRPDRMDK
jgi:hypothetical protein